MYPYGFSITAGEMGRELVPMAAMRDEAIAFSDDGRGIQDSDMMRKAMTEAARLGKLIVAHCEDNSLLRGAAYMTESYAAAHGHRGICSESEFGQIARDLKLAKRRAALIMCAMYPPKKAWKIIRAAKRDGVDVTCETAPHYLVLDDSDLREDGRFKMNPPLRGRRTEKP